ncbi:MAG: choice-of-anchor L domain-containing protein [Bacteroidales bacterium]|nr:choice-of-anchor L domain-containing protein [Bacteroidales bacterium]
MKPVFIKGLSFFVMIVLFSFSLIGQENNGIEPGRKYPPFNPPESHNGSGLNTDAPAGSISVAENATYNSYNPQQLVQNVLVTGCLTATNVRFGYYKRQGNNWYWHNHNWSSNAGNRQMAYFNKATSTFPLDEGILLTTGRASSAMGPNNTGSRSDQIEDDASDPDLANITNRTMRDAAVLEFDFIPAGNTLEFTYIFTSEEYIEYCETQYNDAFGFFLSGPGINGTYTNNAVNLALIPVNIPVSVNTIHPAGTNINNNTFPAENAQYYLDNPNGSLTMQFDGGTVVLTATYPVVPCSTYRIKMAVGDASDQKWDAGVFLGARSFNSESLNITNYGNFIQDQNNIFEGCNNFFRVERDSSDLSLPQNVNLILSGTCTNGVDIQIPGNLPFPSVVTIPANAAYIDIPYIAPTDGIIDNGETLVISVATSCPCASVVQYITRTIVINEQVIINSVNAINAQCNGQSNGAITVNASGGSGNYLYSIDNGSNWQSLNNFTGLNAGTYTILVRDPGSCYPDASATAVIGDPTPIVADAGPDAEICPGASAQLNGSGGVIYSWSPSYGLNFTNVANPVASPVTTTTYTLTVTNASGECASTDQVTVVVSPGPVAPSSISVNRNILCSNDNENITLTANGGSGNLLRWFAGSCGSATIGTGTSISIPSPEITTLYFARWETSCGYSGCAQITVNVPLPINLDNLVINNASCEIGNNGSIILVANGGVSPYSYSLSPNIGNQIIPGTFTNLSPQLYSITVTDANNCTSVTSALVETSADTTDPLILSCSDPQSINVLEACFGQVPDFTSGIVVSDDCTPVINLIISQSPPAGSIAPLGITPIIITVTDASGNSANCSTSLTITDNQGPTISGPGNIIVNADPGLCSASSVNLGLPVANDNCGLESVVNNAPSIFPVGNTLVTWTATDLSGLTATSTQVVTVIDNQPPTIICPPSVVVNADPGQSFASGVNLGTPVTSDNCGVDTTYNNAPSQFPVGSTLVTWTVIDINGLSATCTQTVVVIDDVEPIVLCPPTIEEECITVVPASYSSYLEFVAAGGSATDNDGIDPASFFLVSETSNNMECPEIISRVYAVADINGNYNYCTQYIIVDDKTDPLLTPPASVTVDCAAVPGIGIATATDNCDPDVTITFEGETQTPGSCPDAYTLTRTWKAVDNCGNEATASQIITVQDVTDPILTIPEDITVECSAIPALGTAVVTATDNCDTEVTITFEGENQTPGACPDAYTITRTWKAVDNCGNEATASQIITVQDVTDPVLTVPEDITVECSAIPALGTAVVTATDNCDTEVTITFEGETQTPGACPDAYTLTRTWKAVDNCGNEATASQIITVQDVTDPVLTVPEDITVECSAIPALGTAVVTATDNCDTEVTITFEGETQTPGACPDAYTITRTWKAVDNCGNEATASQIITVQDVTDPLLTIPEDITVECSAIPALGTAVVTATDNCDTEVTITFEGETQTPGACPDAYTLTRTWKAVDNCGNEATASQIITVQDVTDPVLTVPEDITVECSAIPALGTAVVTATDNCDTEVTITFEGETQTPGACPDAYTLTRTWKAVDNCGNEATASQIITVQDVTDPVLTVPEDITVECSAIPALGTEIVTATDNCDTEVTITFEGETQTPGACPDAYTLTRTWKAVDNCGNEATASQIITVQDVTDPVLTVPEDITVECDAIPALGTAVVTATDNCDTEVTITFEGETQTPGACPDAYTLTRTWKAVDNCGNEATSSQIITVQDVTDPVLTVPEDITAECSAIPALGTEIVTATDNCDTEVTITFEGETQTPGACPDAYTITRTWKAVDNCGNEATASQIITVQDVTDPVLTVPEDITVECDAIPALGTAVVTATDNCDSDVTITFEGETQTPGACPDAYTLTRTWKAVDNCGNEATASQIITVQDVTDPVLTVPEDITAECDAIPALGTAFVTATDNCDTEVTITFEGETQTPGACPDAIPSPAHGKRWTTVEMKPQPAKSSPFRM